MCHAMRLENEEKLHTLLTFSGMELSIVKPMLCKALRTLDGSWEEALEGSGDLLS